MLALGAECHNYLTEPFNNITLQVPEPVFQQVPLVSLLVRGKLSTTPWQA